jgi:hypothetical protein
MEIENQPDTNPAHAVVGVQLRFMHRQDGGDSLDFQNHLPRDDNIGLEPPRRSTGTCTSRELPSTVE